MEGSEGRKRKAGEEHGQEELERTQEYAATSGNEGQGDRPAGDSAASEETTAVPNSKRPRTDEEEEEPERKGEAGASHGRQEEEGAQGAADVQVGDFDLVWDQYDKFGSGQLSGVYKLVGSRIPWNTCDSEVPPSMVARGRRLLDLLAPPGPIDGERGSAGSEEDQDDEEEDVAIGPWRFDAETTEERLALITGQKRPVGVNAAAPRGPQLMVYRASATIKTAGQPGERLQKDRFEVTHAVSESEYCGISREYVIVVDKVNRRFVFVGEDEGHPHCGTNEFIYDNSDGSGPGLTYQISQLSTLESLLATARQRFIEFCQNRYH